jgi:outer membrane receptor protein involved in Fe transport
MSLRRKVITCIFVAACSAGGFAQSVVEGHITDDHGRPVPNAEVVLKHNQGERRLVTNGEGKFRFLGAEPGEYEITASAEGFYNAEYEFAARPRQPVVVEMELVPQTVRKEEVEVRSADISMGETGASRLLTHSEIAALPIPLKRDLPTLALFTFPGATLSHDNFVHVRGNEVSLQEFIDGVSFLENPQEQFSPGLSPDMFETINMVSGIFPAEFGNRFGGALDVTTRSGFDLQGHGSVSAGEGSFNTKDATAEYGGTAGKFGYYLFGNGFTSDWYLNPPEPEPLHDFGFGLRGAGQFDYRVGKDAFSLFLTGNGTNAELPNLLEDQLQGRNASRRLRSQTGILNWQHTASPNLLVSTSVYDRTLDDRLAPTTDPFTPFGDGQRDSLTAGIKSDVIWSHGKHIIKAGVDLIRLREQENFVFDSREVPLPPEDPPALSFHHEIRGGQASLYAQDHVMLTPNWSADLGLRWDYFDLTGTFAQVSPRASLAYHLPSSRSTVHFAYNRFFSPPPLEYVQLANFFGISAPDPGDRVGPVHPYRQHYFEAGLEQEINPKVALEVTGFYHRGTTPFEYREISITHLFLPINSSRAVSYGAETGITLKQLQRLGLSARLQYAYQRTFFFGPIAGGYAVGEDIAPGEKFLPAFDEPHSGTASLMYNNKWRNLFGGLNLRYGSGTAAFDGAVRLPGHTTADISAGLDLWRREAKRAVMQFNLTNMSDNRYQIAKESEEIPIQYAAPRVIAGHIMFYF